MSYRNEYWLEALDYAFDMCGCFGALTDEQRKEVAKSLAHSAEMESEATGRLCIPNPMKAELQQQKEIAARDAALIRKEAEIWRNVLAGRLGVKATDLYINNGQVFVDPR